MNTLDFGAVISELIYEGFDYRDAYDLAFTWLESVEFDESKLGALLRRNFGV